MKLGVKEMVAQAEAEIETLSVDDARALQDDDDVQFIDLRDVRELYREGKITRAQYQEVRVKGLRGPRRRGL